MIVVKEVKQARDAWIKAVEARDINATTSLYDAEKGVLLGTLDTEDTRPRQGAAKIRDYFVHFLANDKVEAWFPPDNNASVQIIGDLAVYSGYYTFRLTKDGQVKTAKAKFTYIYQKQSGVVKILLHNSGLTPQGIKQE